MRLFGRIKDTYKKSEAAVVVQNLLEMQQKSGLFDCDPASSATSLIDAVWTKNPHLFDGRFGQRPHKISLAASAFANAIEVLGVRNPNSICFTVCIGNILNEISVNGKLYPFNNLDMTLLDTAAETFSKVSEEFKASPLGKEINDLLGRDEMRAAAEGDSRAKINRALGSKGVQLTPEEDNHQYSIQASAAIVRLIAKEAGVPVGVNGDEDDNFVAGIFAFVISNHVSHMIGAQFEMVSSVVVIDLLGQDAASQVNGLARSYNRMSQEGRVVEAIGQNIAKWITAPSVEQFSKLAALYKLCRENA